MCCAELSICCTVRPAISTWEFNCSTNSDIRSMVESHCLGYCEPYFIAIWQALCLAMFLWLYSCQLGQKAQSNIDFVEWILCYCTNWLKDFDIVLFIKQLSHYGIEIYTPLPSLTWMQTRTHTLFSVGRWVIYLRQDALFVWYDWWKRRLCL